LTTFTQFLGAEKLFGKCNLTDRQTTHKAILFLGGNGLCTVLWQHVGTRNLRRINTSTTLTETKRTTELKTLSALAQKLILVIGTRKLLANTQCRQRPAKNCASTEAEKKTAQKRGLRRPLSLLKFTRAGNAVFKGLPILLCLPLLGPQEFLLQRFVLGVRRKIFPSTA
jgi:hypothetical protein